MPGPGCIQKVVLGFGLNFGPNRSQDDLYYLEQAAKVQVLAMSTGAPLALVDEDVCKSVKTFGSIVAQGFS